MALLCLVLMNINLWSLFRLDELLYTSTTFILFIISNPTWKKFTLICLTYHYTNAIIDMHNSWLVLAYGVKSHELFSVSYLPKAGSRNSYLSQLVPCVASCQPLAFVVFVVFRPVGLQEGTLRTLNTLCEWYRPD